MAEHDMHEKVMHLHRKHEREHHEMHMRHHHEHAQMHGRHEEARHHMHMRHEEELKEHGGEGREERRR